MSLVTEVEQGQEEQGNGKAARSVSTEHVVVYTFYVLIYCNCR